MHDIVSWFRVGWAGSQNARLYNSMITINDNYMYQHKNKVLVTNKP